MDNQSNEFELWRLLCYSFLLRKIRNPTSKPPKARSYLYSLCSTVKYQAIVKETIKKNNSCSFIKHRQSKPLLSYRQFPDIWNWLWWSLKGHCCLQYHATASRNRATWCSHNMPWSIYLPLPSDLWTLKMPFPEDSRSTLMAHPIPATSHLVLINCPLIFDVTSTKTKNILTCRCYERLRQPQI